MISDAVETVVIVGGGPAGSAAGCVLADAGLSPLLIERDLAPRDKVCGEFLSVTAQRYLGSLGIDLDALGASRITSIRLSHGRAAVQADLPFTGRGLSRAVLDEALLQNASAKGSRVFRGVRVKELSTDRDLIEAQLDSSARLRAKAFFLATGKHEVRGVWRRTEGTVDDLIGFKMHVVLSAPQQAAMDGIVELHLYPDGYAGLQMIEGDLADLCLLVKRSRFEKVGSSWAALMSFLESVCPGLVVRLDGSVAKTNRPVSIYQVPYGFLHEPEPTDPNGLFRIGDQVGVIPSFSGEGISIALHTGCLAASLFLRNGSSTLFHRLVRDDIGGAIRVASLFDRLSRWPGGRSSLLLACRTWPGAMRLIASLTRVPDRSALMP